METAPLTTREKALALNLDATTYGFLAEIGGGQEVARWFFSVGHAAGTVAKTISAYDTAVSDGLYGHAKRYVSRERLASMLQQEFSQLVERLQADRGQAKCFFAFADTVATRSFKKAETGRAWLGIRFQHKPKEDPSEIILHAHLSDWTALRQQETLGVLGVNLIHGAFYQRTPIDDLVASLMDGLTREQVEIDMIKVSGPAFVGIDNRLLSLGLVQRGYTDAAMFTDSGEVVQPSEILYKRPILVERGSFRPPTKVTIDLLEGAKKQFLNEPGVTGNDPIVLAEMTLRNLNTVTDTDHADFLARADVLAALGYDVLISRFEPYYQLAEYLARYTDAPIGLAVGLPSMRQIADEQYYAELPGGVLESAGRLFKRSVTMYVYPTRNRETGAIETLESARIPPPWHHLHKLLLETKRIVPIQSYDESLLSIRTDEVLAKIQHGDSSWESMVPPAAVKMIKAKHLFQSPT